jgi:hypothetical protein
MTALACWTAEDPCPCCGSALARADDGTGPVTDQCQACGWSLTLEPGPEGGQR